MKAFLAATLLLASALSLFGLAGVMLALEEGVEVNVLGLTLGIDLKNPALKLPGVGRIGL